MASTCTAADAPPANPTSGSSPPAAAIFSLLSAVGQRQCRVGGLVSKGHVVAVARARTIHAQVGQRLGRLPLHSLGRRPKQRDHHFNAALVGHASLVFRCSNARMLIQSGSHVGSRERRHWHHSATHR